MQQALLKRSNASFAYLNRTFKFINGLNLSDRLGTFPRDICDLKCHGWQRSSVFLWRDRDFFLVFSRPRITFSFSYLMLLMSSDHISVVWCQEQTEMSQQHLYCVIRKMCSCDGSTSRLRLDPLSCFLLKVKDEKKGKDLSIFLQFCRLGVDTDTCTASFSLWQLDRYFRSFPSRCLVRPLGSVSWSRQRQTAT